MTFLQCGYVAVLRNALKIKSQLLQALFEKQGTLASHPNCEVLQMFPEAPMAPVGGQLGRDSVSLHPGAPPTRKTGQRVAQPACHSPSHRKSLLGPLIGEVLTPELVSQGLVHKVLLAKFFPTSNNRTYPSAPLSTCTAHPRQVAFMCQPVPRIWRF